MRWIPRMGFTLALALGLMTLGCQGESVYDSRTVICADSDGDGYGIFYPTGEVPGGYRAAAHSCKAEPDCDDADASNWNLCGACRDADGDGAYLYCNSYVGILGPDCDDSATVGVNVWYDPANVWNTCSTCNDSDADGQFGNCNAYNSLPGPDRCQPAVTSAVAPNQWTRACSYCIDADGDLYFSGCDRYTATSANFLGQDYCDGNPNNWTVTNCVGCKDSDGDTFFVGCDSYSMGGGAMDHCDDDPYSWTQNSCDFCADSDGDGYYSYEFCDAPEKIGNGDEDHCDGDFNNWTEDGCNLCEDYDGDGYFSQCDSYTGLGGGSEDQCDDPLSPIAAYNHTPWGCGNCKDQDSDGYFITCDSYPNGTNDKCDLNPNNWTALNCGRCTDQDHDSWYVNCDVFNTVFGPDCASTDPDHWDDCGACIDLDGDDYGDFCNLGGDCDDDPVTGPPCFENCAAFYYDDDGDNHGDAATDTTACSPPMSFVGDSTDCDDNLSNEWSGCVDCADGDTDRWGAGAGCDGNEDCDDTNDTCNTTCPRFYRDNDHDTYGFSGDSVTACAAPADYVLNSGDACDDVSNAWSDTTTCLSCIDSDGDMYGVGTCDTTEDCGDSIINAWTVCGSTCADNDGDMYGAGTCDAAEDCDDAIINTWTLCAACNDNDGDMYGAGTCNGASDCDDTILNTWTICGTTCVDNDGDMRGAGTCNGTADACDNLANAWTAARCASCSTDADSDAWGVGTCDDTPDCDDTAATGTTCHAACPTFYRDADTDTRGTSSTQSVNCVAPAGYVANSNDNCDNRANAWTAANCPTCIPDADGDLWGIGTCDGAIDCDDTVATGTGCHAACPIFYRDADMDTRGTSSTQSVNCVVPGGYVNNSNDNCDNRTNAWTASACTTTCTTDADADLWGIGTCDDTIDCDDTVATGAACHAGCPTFYRDADGDTRGTTATQSVNCSVPAGYVADSTDACDNRTNAWTAANCPTCTPDADTDLWGIGTCDAAVDCDDDAVTGGTCHTGCSTVYRDADADTRGTITLPRSTCTTPISGYVSNSNDNCDDRANAWTVAACGTCTPDADADLWGVGTCNLAIDCDDTAATGGSCHTGCATYYQDIDTDTHGNPLVTLDACSVPTGYVSLDDDCEDTDPDVYAGAPELCDALDNNCPGDAGYGLEDEGAGCMGVVAGATVCFRMGDSTSTIAGETPMHDVCLSPFSMDLYEITIREYKQCVAATSCTAPAGNNGGGHGGTYYTDSIYDLYPVVRVTRAQASAYCLWRGKRLPTEAEWEYAARGGDFQTKYYWGDTISSGRANYNTSATTEVGSFNATAFGLYDLYGNLYEWVSDYYANTYYATCEAGGTVDDPAGPGTGTTYSIRGGAFTSAASGDALRSGARSSYSSSGETTNLGFRCADAP